MICGTRNERAYMPRQDLINPVSIEWSGMVERGRRGVRFNISVCCGIFPPREKSPFWHTLTKLPGMHRGSIKPEQIRLVTHDEAYDNKERGVAHVREEAETCLVLTDS